MGKTCVGLRLKMQQYIEKTAALRAAENGLFFGRLGGQRSQQTRGFLAGVKVRRELDDLFQQGFGFAAVLFGKVGAGNPQGGGDAVQLLGVVLLNLRFELLDVSLSGRQQSHALVVQLAGECHALLHGLGFLNVLKLLLEPVKLVEVFFCRGNIAHLFRAIAEIAGNRVAADESLLRLLSLTHSV